MNGAVRSAVIWWVALLLAAVVAGAAPADEGRETNCQTLGVRVIAMTNAPPFPTSTDTVFVTKVSPHRDPVIKQGIYTDVLIDKAKLLPITYIQIHNWWVGEGMLHCSATAFVGGDLRQHIEYWSYLDPERSRGFLFTKRSKPWREILVLPWGSVL